MMLSEVAAGCGKRNYDSLKAARTAALAIHKRAGQQLPDAYHCKACGSYHFGRNPKKQKEPNMLAMTDIKRAVVPPPAVENRELSWLAQRIARSQKEPFSEIVTLTPSIARNILERNSNNRAVRSSLVDQIAADISVGMWDLNGEAIIIAKTGELNDGQHRLNAVVQAGKPIRTLIIFGMERDSRYTVDMGNSRSAGDFIGMEGGKYATSVAAAARLYNQYRRGYYSTGVAKGQNPPPTKQMVRAEYWNNDKVFNRAADEFCTDKFAKMVSPTSLIAAYVILSKVNEAQAVFFFSKLKSGADLNRSDAILGLRLRLLESRSKKMRPQNKLEMILRHWNAWREQKPIKKYIPQSEYPQKLER